MINNEGYYNLVDYKLFWRNLIIKQDLIYILNWNLKLTNNVI
jgi:hypothetical protein